MPLSWRRRLVFAFNDELKRYSGNVSFNRMCSLGEEILAELRSTIGAEDLLYLLLNEWIQTVEDQRTSIL